MRSCFADLELFKDCFEALHKCCLTCSQSRLVLVLEKIRSVLRDERRVVCYDSSFSWKRGRRTGLSQPCVLDKSCRQTTATDGTAIEVLIVMDLRRLPTSTTAEAPSTSTTSEHVSPHIVAMIFSSQVRKSFKSGHHLQN